MRLPRIISCLLLCALAPAQEPGVKTGQRIPEFELSDQDGKAQSLAALAGPAGLMLVFFRSADW